MRQDTLIEDARLVFNKEYSRLSSIIEDDTFFSKKNIATFPDAFSSHQLVLKSYSKESYYDLLCDVPYEYQKHNIEILDDDLVSNILDMQIEYQDKLYLLIQKISKKRGWWDVERKELGSRGQYVEWISADFERIFEYCTISHWAGGKVVSKFLDIQLNVYEKGGFPCGWDGVYPNGKIVVFIPIYESCVYKKPRLP